MTKDKFLKWCEDNAHKFVVISYQGGAGGEGLCNYLTQDTDLFYNSEFIEQALEKGIVPKDLITHVKGIPNSTDLAPENDLDHKPSSGRKPTFHDFLFADCFVLDGVDNLYTSHCWAPEYEQLPIIPEELMENPFERLYDHLRNRKDPDSERASLVYGGTKEEHSTVQLDEIAYAFAAQDKPYLIRTHGITPLTMCWGSKAKYFSISGGDYQEYIQMLEAMKVYLQPEWKRERKMEALRLADWRYQIGITGIWGEKSNMYYLKEDWEPELTSEENTKRFVDYFKPILDDDTIPLYYRTIDIVSQHENFGVNINQMDCIMLNNLVYGIILGKFWPRISISYFKNDAVTVKRLEMKETDMEKVHQAMADKVDPYDMNWPDSDRAKRVTIDFWNKNHKVRDEIGIIQITFDQLYSPDYLKDNGIDVNGMHYLAYWNDWHNKSVEALAKIKLFPRRVPSTL